MKTIDIDFKVITPEGEKKNVKSLNEVPTKVSELENDLIEANPTEEATETLSKLGVNGVVYGVGALTVNEYDKYIEITIDGITYKLQKYIETGFKVIIGANSFTTSTELLINGVGTEIGEETKTFENVNTFSIYNDVGDCNVSINNLQYSVNFGEAKNFEVTEDSNVYINWTAF